MNDPTLKKHSHRPDIQENWWKEAVVYQIYPRSFQDSNNDGIGDLQGIISRLSYLQSLGIDVVWLNPIFTSPNDDNGYDISDYRGIMAEFGTMADFDALVSGLHERGIRLVLDLVANHSSDEHEWFRQSRISRSSPFRDFYHWWPAEKGKPASRYSFFDIDQDAWMFDPATDSYYLHYFSQKQPDLNWENPLLRKEIYDIMRFWLEKGIDGFRMDVLPFISKDHSFPKLPELYQGNFIRYYANGPRLHEFIREMHDEVLSKYDIMTVAEGAGISREEALDYVDPDRNELNMLYHFEGTDIPYLSEVPDPAGPEYDLLLFKEVYSAWDRVYAEKGWGTIYLGNHDQSRMVSRWGNDSPGFRELSSKMLTTFLLTMRGTPYYYAGDETGMANIRFENIEEYNDISTINKYRKLESENGDLVAFLEHEKRFSRDNGRTPFQWDSTVNAGFSKVKPWLRVNGDHKEFNVEKQDGDPRSCLNYFRQMIRFRKENKALVYGTYSLLDKENPRVYAYTRHWKDETFLVLLNFSCENAGIEAGLIPGEALPAMGNYPEFSSVEILRPYEAIVYKWNN